MKKKRKIVYPLNREKRKQKLTAKQSMKEFIIQFFTNKFTLAIATGLIVGSVFGLISLNILKNEQGEANFTDGQVFSSNKETKTAEADEQLLSFEYPTFYVIQNGLFHKRENAEQIQAQLQGQNISSFIWERKDEFYVLHSIHQTASLAEEHKAKLDNLQVDAYVKQWDMLVTNKKVSKEEEVWLEQFLTVWSETVGQVNNKKEIETKQWEKLLQTDYQSDLIASLQEKILERQAKLEQEERVYVDLLAILFHVEQALGE